MSEFEDKLSAVLGNPEAMGQIMNIAKSLGAGSAEPSDGDTAGATVSGGDFSSLLEHMDPKLIQLAMGLMAEYNSGDDDKTALLSALRPFVKKKRYKKLDRAVQIAKLSRLIRVAVGTFGGGDGDV